MPRRSAASTCTNRDFHSAERRADAGAEGVEMATVDMAGSCVQIKQRVCQRCEFPQASTVMEGPATEQMSSSHLPQKVEWRHLPSYRARPDRAGERRQLTTRIPVPPQSVAKMKSASSNPLNPATESGAAFVWASTSSERASAFRSAGVAAASSGKAGRGPIVAIVSGGNIGLKTFCELVNS